MQRTWNRTKIVCTIGPASSDARVIERLLEAGMDVARLNFSHGTYEAHRKVIETLRRVAAKRGWPLAILQDLQGPRIRIGKFEKGPVELVKGARFTITTRDVPGDASIVSTSYRSLPRDVRKGNTVLIADGKIELRVLKGTGNDVLTEVVTGGPLSNNKGMNIPNVPLSIRTITPKDVRDIKFGAALGVDYIAISFVRTAADVLTAERHIGRAGRSIPVIAKIERPEAIENLDSIIDAAGGIMVARGDLGVEISSEDVPLLQKQIIRRANEKQVPVITATQMLVSMVANTRPTRAEASDVANAILDGTDAVMLSEETAAGQHPVEAVLMMSRIAEKVEAGIPLWGGCGCSDEHAEEGMDIEALSEFVPGIAAESGARLICAFSRSGRTALMVSKNRPMVPIVGLTPREDTFRRMNLFWGVEPVLVGEVKDIDAMMRLLGGLLTRTKKVRRGDRVVVVAGYPFGKGAHSNMVLIQEIP